MTETRFVICDECDGAGEWDEGPQRGSCGEPIYKQVICPKCNGSGRAEEEVEPIEMEDL